MEMNRSAGRQDVDGSWVNATVSGTVTTSITNVSVSNVDSITISAVGGWMNATVSGVTVDSATVSSQNFTTSVVGAVQATVSGTVTTSVDAATVSSQNFTTSVISGFWNNATVSGTVTTSVDAATVSSQNFTTSVIGGSWHNATVSGTVALSSYSISNLDSVTVSGTVTATVAATSVSNVDSVTVSGTSLTISGTVVLAATSVSNVDSVTCSGTSLTVSVTNVGAVTCSGTTLTVSVVNIAAGTNVIGAVKLDETNYTKYWNYAALATAGADQTVWTPATTLNYINITDIIVSALYEGTITVVDGTGVGTGSTIMIFALGDNGGACKTFRTPIATKTAGNTIAVECSVTGGYIMLAGYETT